MSNQPPSELPSRRDFFATSVGFLAFAGTAIPLASALANRPPASLVDAKSEDTWVFALSTDELAAVPKGKVQELDLNRAMVEGWRAKQQSTKVFLRINSDGVPIVYSSRCPHLGCAVELRKQLGNQEFFCACHQGVFNSDGSISDGPPKRALDTLPSRLTDNGLEVRLARFILNSATKVEA